MIEINHSKKYKFSFDIFCVGHTKYYFALKFCTSKYWVNMYMHECKFSNSFKYQDLKKEHLHPRPPNMSRIFHCFLYMTCHIKVSIDCWKLDQHLPIIEQFFIILSRWLGGSTLWFSQSLKNCILEKMFDHVYWKKWWHP
jgi:hypothetical protein